MIENTPVGFRGQYNAVHFNMGKMMGWDQRDILDKKIVVIMVWALWLLSRFMVIV